MHCCLARISASEFTRAANVDFVVVVVVVDAVVVATESRYNRELL